MKIPISDVFKKMGKEMFTFVRETTAAATGEVVSEEVKKKITDKRGELVKDLILSVRDKDARETLWEIHQYWWKVKKRENAFVQQMSKIPPENRDEVFTEIARWWAQGKREKVEQFFYALEHDWWQQPLREAIHIVTGAVKEVGEAIKNAAEENLPRVREYNKKIEAEIARKLVARKKRGW